MKIGVTGGTGFIGRSFVSRYCTEHDLTILTLENEKVTPFGNEQYISSDFSEESIMENFKGCDAIVHLAFARPAIGKQETFSDYFDSISLSEKVFSAAKKLAVTNVVVMSSRSVYNSRMKMPLSEERVDPYSLYGAAKAAVENIGEIYNRCGMKIKFLRSAQVMGVGERKNLMTVYLEKAMNKEPLTVYGEGVSTKTYIYVKDIARAIMCAVYAHDVSGAFNIAMEKPISNRALAETYCEIFDNRRNIVFLKDKEEDGEFWQIDIAKAKDQLGFFPEYDIGGALRDMKRIIEKD